jgi:membrane protein required for colicin V production
MQSYDVLMLLVLAATALWGYWKGFVWQLASLLSIFCSYFAAYGLRMQVAKMIDADPPWNIFAAMLIVYLMSSVGIWILTAMMSGALSAFQLKDFDRQIGAIFGVAKGVIFCLLITFFAVTLLGAEQAERICQSNSGYYIARLLKRSSGLIPPEMAGVVEPFLNPFQERLEGYQEGVADAPAEPAQDAWSPPTAAWQVPDPWAQAAQQWAAQQWAQQQQSPPPQVAYPPPDPRYYPPPNWPQQPAPNPPPTYQNYSPPQYAPPANQPPYQGYPQSYPNGYQQPPAQPAAAPQSYDPRQDPRYDPRYAGEYQHQAYSPPPNTYAPPPQQTQQPAPDPRYYWR